MASLDDPGVKALLDEPNHAVLSTLGDDGSIHSAVVWCDVLDGQLAVNSAVGRKWPTDLERNPTVTVLVYDQGDPYTYVEVRGRAVGSTEGAKEHIDRLAQKYVGTDYPSHQPGEQRITFRIEAERVRHRTSG